MRIILDTNVIVSGLLKPEGNPGRVAHVGRLPIESPTEFVRRWSRARG